MILREATKDDAPRLAAFIRRELAAWGYDSAVTAATVSRHLNRRWRYAMVEEDGAISAALAGRSLLTDDGPGYEIRLWLVAYDHPDKISAMDALALWGANTLSSEGVVLLLSRRSPGYQGAFYGRDYLGMEMRVRGRDPVTKEAVVYAQAGSPETVIRHILDRRPEWRPSL